MFFRKKKSRVEIVRDVYLAELRVLKERATDPDLPEDERVAAQEKLREMDLHHTRKINGCTEHATARMKEEK